MQLSQWMAQGGLIMKVLLFLNIVGWSVMLWKAVSIYMFNKKINLKTEDFNTFFSQYHGGKVEMSPSDLLTIALSHYLDPFYKGMDTIKIIASISPLLGLLGTVWGILSSFSVIAQKGLDNPALFAEGISMALVTTVGGLIVAIPHFVGHNYLRALLVHAEKKLEKQLLR